MFKNYLKIAWRNIKRQKIYSAINVIGLAVGLSSSLILFFYVHDDLTYDRFHEHFNSIYRVTGNARSAIHPGPLIPASIEEIPEVAAGVRMTIFGRIPIQRADQAQEEESEQNAPRVLTLATDPGFFDVFSFKNLRGDLSGMDTPNGVFLTPDIASVLFGEEDPIGQPLFFQAVENAYVAGIAEAPPPNSHIQYEAVVRLRVEQNPNWWDSWINSSLAGYVRLHAGAESSAVEEKMTKLAHDRDFRYSFMDEVFNGQFVQDRQFASRLGAFSGVAIFIACLGLIGMVAFSVEERRKEIAIRKVLGSSEARIIRLLGSDFLKWVAVANIIAWPLGYFGMNRWLNAFVYRVPFTIWPFVIAGTCALAIALLTMFYQSLRAARTNPASVLRHDK
jgi:hypothetical protein